MQCDIYSFKSILTNTSRQTEVNKQNFSDGFLCHVPMKEIKYFECNQLSPEPKYTLICLKTYYSKWLRMKLTLEWSPVSLLFVMSTLRLCSLFEIFLANKCKSSSLD